VIPFATSYANGRIVASQDDVIFMPRNGARGKRGVILLHGQDTSLLVWSNPSGTPGQASIGTALASVGFVCVSIFDEGNGWGNDAAVADIDAARVYLGTLGCATDKVLLVGASMGVVDALNYTRAHPDRVAAVIGMIPGSDVDDMRDNNRAGTTQAAINTAWGLAAGSTSATVPLPARANPTADANAAAIAGSGAIIKLYYSTVDTVVLPSTVTALAAKLGITATAIDSTTGHSDATVGKTPTDEVAQTLYALA
jgi:pimeloyl-ACP methyl ester carboxylesterase